MTRVAGAALTLSLLAASGAARAEEPPSTAAEPSAAPHPFPPLTLHATAFVGDGLRFNDPYRLATVLGPDAESVSRTAAYLDVGAQAMLGDPRKLLHGFALRVSFAMEGVPQAVLTPSYVLEKRFVHLAVYGRAGTPIVLTPDVTWGLEGAVGGVWFVRAGLGLAAELVGDLFYGAGTREVSAAAYPVLGAQLGIVLAYEVLP